MAAQLIDGKAFALGLRGKIAEGAAQFLEKAGRKPGLDVVLVGDDPASHVYVGNKEKTAGKVGFQGRVHRLAADTQQDQLNALIDQLNADDSVDGVLVQMPLPAHLDPDAVFARLSPAKDVDGLTPTSAGLLLAGSPSFVPCTPLGCQMLIKSVLGDISGANALVIGRSILVGRPLAQLLLNDNATVTVAHSRTKDLAALCREADIVCAAVGRPEMVRGDWIKPGATVIDIGINRVERDGVSKLVGDVAFEEAKEQAAHITPVPGGVGPMTIACLMHNTLRSAQKRAGVTL